MKHSRVLLLALYFGVASYSITAWGADPHPLADRLWASQTEDEARMVYKEIEGLPVEEYVPLLLNVNQSPLSRNTEAAPFMSAVVYHYYLKKESGTNVTTALLGVIRSGSTPIGLKRDLLRDITTWYSGPLEVAVKELNGLDDESQVDIWLIGQFAVTKLIQAYSREADMDRRQEINEIAELCLSKSITRLVALFSGEQKANWSAKTLATYRKVLGPRFDKLLIDNLRGNNYSLSRRLLLLEQISGWGHRSKDVLDYLKEIEHDYAREGAQSNIQDRAVIDKLIRFHEDPVK